MREQYSRQELNEIQQALQILSDSSFHIELFGGSTQHQHADRGRRVYRVVGACNDHYGMTLAQATFGESNGPIRCQLFPADHLPGKLAGCLPRCQPGSQPAATFHPGDIHGRPDGHMQSVARSTPRACYQRLWERPSDGGGSARLYLGPGQQAHPARFHDRMAPVRTIHARPNAKYFGRKRGITWLNMINDQASSLAAQVLSGNPPHSVTRSRISAGSLKPCTDLGGTHRPLHDPDASDEE